MTSSGGELWPIVTVFGVIVLGLALVYGIMQNRKKTKQQDRLTETGTEELYRAEDKATKRGDN